VSHVVCNLDRDGRELRSFLADDGEYAYGIAMDPADGTLWVGGDASNVIYQYDTTGVLLASIAVPGIGSAFGIEFGAVPRCYVDFDNNAWSMSATSSPF
jgi:hypothetical protein